MKGFYLDDLSRVIIEDRFRVETQRIPMRIRGEMMRLPAIAATVFDVSIGQRDRYRHQVDERALVAASTLGVTEVLSGAIAHCHHVNECREWIRDLVDQ